MTSIRQSTEGLLIIGHGTRESKGVAAMLDIARQTAALTRGSLVEPCFLEMASPTIAQGVGRLVAQGARRIRAVPLLLFAAGHVRRDIPRALAASQSEYPDVEIEQAAHLGCQTPIVELSARRYREAMVRQPAAAGEKTSLIMVGRGSRDADATREMYDFAEHRRRMVPVDTLQVCFLAFQQPRLPLALEQAAKSGAKQVVVQPHLLFAGTLLERFHAEVNLARKRWPATDWITTDVLGPEQLIAMAVAAESARQNRSALDAVSEGELMGGNSGGWQSELVPGWISG
jgi:sirohydrochlorin ferrochelatase